MLSPLLFLLALPPAPPELITSSEAARQLCLATRPAARFTGSPEEREGFTERRKRLLAARYEATVALSQVELSDVDEDQRLLWFLRSGPLHTAQGVTLFLQQRRLELTATSAVAAGEHAMSRLATGQKRHGVLRLIYELADADGAGPCPAGVKPGAVPVLMARPVTLSLLDAQGTVLATGSGEDAGETRAPPGGKPVVEVAPATVDGRGPGAEAVTEKARTRSGALSTCFEEALARDPTVDGSIVFQLALDAAGKVKDVTLVADTVEDEGLSACARKALGSTLFGKGGPASVLLPVHFDRK